MPEINSTDATFFIPIYVHFILVIYAACTSTFIYALITHYIGRPAAPAITGHVSLALFTHPTQTQSAVPLLHSDDVRRRNEELKPFPLPR